MNKLLDPGPLFSLLLFTAFVIGAAKNHAEYDVAKDRFTTCMKSSRYEPVYLHEPIAPVNVSEITKQCVEFAKADTK